MLPHTARTELTTCFDVAAAGRYPYTGRLGVLSAADKQQVRAALELVQAAPLADRDFTKISDGQRPARAAGPCRLPATGDFAAG